MPVPGGFLEDNEHLRVFQSPIVEPATDVYVGYLFVTPKRHLAGFSDLNDDEAAAMGLALAHWSRALETAGAEHLYVLRIGHGVPHLHVHLVARWPETPKEVPWLKVDEWPGARRGHLDFATDFVNDLRASVTGRPPRD